MHLNIDVAIECLISAGDPVLFMIEAAQMPGQTVVEASLDIDHASLRRIGDGGGRKVWAFMEGDQFKLRYRATVEVSRADIALAELPAPAMHALPEDVLTYLRPSRFCQSDLFTDFVAQKFGGFEGGAKIVAIRDWAAAEIAYVSGSSHGATTAVETFSSRQGVCRDFAHVVCALARAAQIPARYVSVYGAGVRPPDFHAVVQVWLDGAWHLIDATDMGETSQLVIIACGRDAADVAFMETQDWAQTIHQSVLVTQG